MKNRALTHPLCSLRTAWIQDLSSISSPKRFLSNLYSFSLKKNICWRLFGVAIYISIYHDSVHPHCGQRPQMLFALCLLLSSSQLTSLSPSLFSNFKRFYYDNVLYSRLFLTERPFFFNSPVTTYPRNFVTTIYSLHMTHEYWPLTLLRYLLTFVTLIVAVCRTGVIYELLQNIEVYSHIESLWLSSRASEHGIRSSKVRFPMRNQNFCSSHARDKMKKHLSLFLY